MKTIPIPPDDSVVAGGAPGPADPPAERFGARLLLVRAMRHARVELGLVIEPAGWTGPALGTASRASA